MSIPSSGVDDKPITFGAYGIGEKPIIDASNLITPGASWSTATQTIWTTTVTAEPKILFFNGTKGTKVASRNDCTSIGKWHWAANVLSIYSASDPNLAYTYPGVEIGARNQAVLNEQNYVTFDGLHFRRGNSTKTANVVSSGNNVTIKNCESSYGAHHGIAYVGSGDNLLTQCNIHDNGTQAASSGIFGYHDTGTTGHENFISHNDIYNNHSFGIQLLSNYYIIEHNQVYDNGNTTHMCVGIEIIDWSQSGYGQHHVIRYNLVYGQISGGDDGEGIYADDFSRYVDIYRNIVYGNDGPGIGTHRAQHISIINNTVFSNCVNSSGNLNYKAEIKVIDDSDNESSDIAIKNNLVQATQSNTYAILLGSFTYNMTGLDVTNNDWYTSATNWYYWNFGGGKDLSVWNSFTGIGTDLNSAPLMFDPSKGNFTLKEASPCRDAGSHVGFIKDYAGNLVVETPDIGAYEYQYFPKPKNIRIIVP